MKSRIWTFHEFLGPAAAPAGVLLGTLVLGLSSAGSRFAPGSLGSTEPLGSSAALGSTGPLRQAESGEGFAAAEQVTAGPEGALLDLAYRAVSAMPLHPHVKNRSRAQEQVVVASLLLGDVERARTFVEGIENWRRGAGYADLAYFLAERSGDSPEVQRLLGLAWAIADGPGEELGQEWRRERILATIARTHVLLGERERAAELEAAMTTPERGAIRVAEARAEGEEAFAAQLVDLRGVIKNGTFDQVRIAFDVCVGLFARFYEDPEKRQRIEDEILAEYDKTPMAARLDLLLRMTDASLAHDDFAKALELTAVGREKLHSVEWLPEDQVPLMARFSERRAQGGEDKEAHAENAAALALFLRSRDRIVDIYRADALIPVAETYASMGEIEQARAVYRRALDEAAVNPNSRPRADDLSAICLSMAQRGVEPDGRLWTQLTTVAKGLGDPW